MSITFDDLREAAKDCLVTAGSSYTPDRLAAYEQAARKEKKENARWFLELILENARIAQREKLPLCDDTGVPHVLVRLGTDCVLPAGWLEAIREGVAAGLRTLPGRPMAVKGDGIQRVEQSQGLFENSDALEHAPVIMRSVPGDKLNLAVLMLGGGPEIRARTRRIFHKRSMEKVIGEVVEWLSEEVLLLGCTPSIPAIGIGRSQVEASALMLEAMADGDVSKQNEWEQKVVAAVNGTHVGPLGLGGDYTVMGCFLKIGPTRASGVRIVTARPCCLVEPRVGKAILA
ncbi:MAG: fumarate hydratase [Desulfovibrio sp.]|jgi:fumarate hydratase subunit alpha|nr:fumarate hydratase [Desulfovibrio sp.]